jgi:hypothetical protein
MQETDRNRQAAALAPRSLESWSAFRAKIITKANSPQAFALKPSSVIPAREQLIAVRMPVAAVQMLAIPIRSITGSLQSYSVARAIRARARKRRALRLLRRLQRFHGAREFSVDASRIL